MEHTVSRRSEARTATLGSLPQCGSGRSDMAGVVPTATDARQLRVPLTHPGVKGGLRVFEVICPALQLLLADLYLPALNLSQRLTRLLLVNVLGGQCTGWTTYGLAKALRNELDRARSVAARLRLGLLRNEAHSDFLAARSTSALRARRRASNSAIER